MIGLMMLAAASSGYFLSGNELYAICGQSEVALKEECLGYASGAADALTILQQATGHEYACIPDGATRGQVKDVVVEYMRAHPENRQTNAGALAVLAFQTAFPCPK